jgi:hypothetical protein
MVPIPSRDYITIRVERTVHDDLCRVRLDLAVDIDSGIDYVPDPGGSFPSLSWVVGWLCRQELSRRTDGDSYVNQVKGTRPARRKGKVPND